MEINAVLEYSLKKMDHFTMGNGRMIKGMEKESSRNQVDTNIKENGSKILSMEEELKEMNSIMFMKLPGSMALRMVLVPLPKMASNFPMCLIIGILSPSQESI
eukprot:CAMPEP_0170542210 /NCGR_PEP_ID=MMETSP0211-20121228/1710_1 /TAXON_ID=311385 /ORGANISM="Pseudokeronopsis sp., Strain OXSARD2" /LENGTH=102 /DNA_ID=CAMNT_0010845199 /DNA_START=318 /DNA_END=626 /DNA_ORIENTATION=-